MLQWIPAITEAHLLREFLSILGNIIKFNASLLDKDIVVGIIQYVYISMFSFLVNCVYNNFHSFKKCL